MYICILYLDSFGSFVVGALDWYLEGCRFKLTWGWKVHVVQLKGYATPNVYIMFFFFSFLMLNGETNHPQTNLSIQICFFTLQSFV